MGAQESTPVAFVAPTTVRRSTVLDSFCSAGLQTGCRAGVLARTPKLHLTPCQAPAVKINPPASRNSFILLSLFSALSFPKFADHFARIATLVLYAANLPTRHHARERGHLANSSIFGIPEGNSPKSTSESSSNFVDFMHQTAPKPPNDASPCLS